MAYQSVYRGFGSTLNQLVLSKANRNYQTQYFKHVHTSGDIRSRYWRVYSTGGGGGEVFRPVMTQNAATVTAATINAIHASLGFGTSGNLLGGLGHAARFSLDTPDAALTGNSGVIGLDINAGGTSTSLGQRCAFIRATMGGNATGLAALEDGVNLFSLNGFTAADGNMIDKSTLRFDIDGTAKYIPYGTTKNSLHFYPISTLGTDNAAGVGIYSGNDSTSFFQNTANDKRSYLLRVQGYRPATLPMGDGVHGVDDAAIYAIYRSYAADEAYCQQRGINAQVNHRGASGGSIGNLIGTNASTSTTLSGDCVTLTLSNEDYAPGTGGVSGCLDCLHTHEGPNAVGGEFGIRVRNAKKNGSVTGAYIALDDATCTTEFAYGLDISEADPGTADIRLQNEVCIVGLTTAITDNSTTTTLPEGSLAITSNSTGKGYLFIADSGGKWQALAQA